MRYAIENRSFISFLFACSVGLTLFFRWPFPVDDPLLGMIMLERPHIYQGIRWTYAAMLFTTPYMISATTLSFLYVFAVKQERTRTAGKLPLYVDPSRRPALSVVVGEVHNPKRREPAEQPRWLEIPARGLYTGTAIFGAIGSGKTTCCMYPFAQQILSHAATDRKRKAAGLVLEVKGDFCHRVRDILKAATGLGITWN